MPGSSESGSCSRMFYFLLVAIPLGIGFLALWSWFGNVLDIAPSGKADSMVNIAVYYGAGLFICQGVLIVALLLVFARNRSEVPDSISAGTFGVPTASASVPTDASSSSNDSSDYDPKYDSWTAWEWEQHEMQKGWGDYSDDKVDDDDDKEEWSILDWAFGTGGRSHDDDDDDDEWIY